MRAIEPQRRCAFATSFLVATRRSHHSLARIQRRQFSRPIRRASSRSASARRSRHFDVRSSVSPVRSGSEEMKDKMSLSHSLWSAIAGLFLLLGNQQASAQETPVAPATTGGTYTVLFTWPVDCYWTYLQERVGPSGAWTYVDTGIMQPAGGLGVNANFTNRPAGEYYYRIEVLYTDEYGGSSYAWSDATRVLVS